MTPERVTLTYEAPVYVTVNLVTGDVERVFMSDESVALMDGIPLVDADTDLELPWETEALAELQQRAAAIADDVDWTSTEGRCQVWRGAAGGPRNMLEVVTAAVDVLVALQETRDFAELGFTRSDLVATQKFLKDSAGWLAEHPETAPDFHGNCVPYHVALAAAEAAAGLAQTAMAEAFRPFRLVPMHLDAECQLCKEHFRPADETDLIHVARENGEECGGLGTIVGSWG